MATHNFRAIASIVDSTNPTEMVLYNAGTSEVLTVGANDYLILDSVSVVATTGFPDVILSSDGTLAGVYDRVIKSVAAGFAVRLYPGGMISRPGLKLYALTGGNNRLEAIVTGRLITV